MSMVIALWANLGRIKLMDMANTSSKKVKLSKENGHLTNFYFNFSDFIFTLFFKKYKIINKFYKF